jgi:hypothetical protein
VAVVQISRIQVRRGQKNQGSGLPQLASGEFGWAVDTQELYIGNGAVSEGAPYVGNTKLLSEHDNLFEFANTYVYKKNLNIQTGDSPNNPVLRTLQDRLDDRVSIRAFGGTGDGTNHTGIIQRAIDELYLNAANKGQPQARVELIFEPGEYLLTDTIHLPPFVTIRGAGSEKTIFLAGNFAAFKTVNETSVPGNYAIDATSTTLNQAREISLKDFTVRSSGNTALVLNNCKDSHFENLTLVGSYSFGDVIDGSNNGITMTALSTAVNTSNNIFNNVKITNFTTAVKSDNDIKDNSWNNCIIDTVWQGFAFGIDTNLGTSGMLTGPINNKIVESKFNEVYTSAIKIINGQDNMSINNKFYSVGNESGTDVNVQHPVIEFGSIRNQSKGDWFERSEVLGFGDFIEWPQVTYVPEVKGKTITEYDYTHELNITQSGEYSKLFKLPAETVRGYEIDYIYVSDVVNAYRSGTISIVLDPVNDTFNLSDDYDFTGDEGYAQDLQFNAEYYVDDGTATISINVLNNTPGDSATFRYKVKTKS